MLTEVFIFYPYLPGNFSAGVSVTPPRSGPDKIPLEGGWEASREEEGVNNKIYNGPDVMSRISGARCCGKIRRELSTLKC